MKVTIMTTQHSYLNSYTDIIKDALSEYDLSIVTNKEEIPEGDVAFFLSCYELIKKPILTRNRHNIVIHESDLPQGKGWSPASWQILEGANDITLTCFEIAEKVDSGDIYFKEKIYLEGTELKDEWQTKIVHKKISMCLKFLKNYINISPEKQQGQETFYAKRSPDDCELDINKTIKDQFNLLRIIDNEKYPAFFYYKNKKYKIKIEKY